MEAVPKKTRAGNVLYFVKFADKGETAFDHPTSGLCIYCGEFCEGVEPDARLYTCDSCGRPGVYGIEECVMLGYVKE